MDQRGSPSANGGASEDRMTDPVANELALQRLWAESRWPTPFLPDPAGGQIRVISPGRWNRGPGPDFRGAQVLDADGQARRGDVELHLTAGDWLQHGHTGDPAYRHLLLHIVDWRGRPRRDGAPLDARIPDVTALPPAASDAPDAPRSPPCTDIRDRAGTAAVEARLRAIARRRFARKARELWSLDVPDGPGSVDDRRAMIAAARALGQSHNGALAEDATRLALAEAETWAEVELVIPDRGWRHGRGVLGSADGLNLVLMTLLRRWTAPERTPWANVERLARVPHREAVAELRIPRALGSARATQLLADAVYPLTGAERQWSLLPGVRYQRTDDLRDRLDGGLVGKRAGRQRGVGGVGFAWKHPHTQALLELEQTRCRQWACRICPLAALDARR